MRRALRNKGFSLMEVLVALSVLAVASVGALSGLVFASKQFRLGQSTTQGTVLAERTMQRLRLANKQKIIAAAVAYTGRPEALDASASLTASASNPWVPTTGGATALGDLSNDGSSDFSRGAFFTVDGAGIAARATVPGAVTTCSTMLSNAAVPPGVYCREVAITSAATLTAARASGALTGTVAGAEVLVRVFRKPEVGAPVGQWTLSEVVVP